ncbi:hypothetical protein IMCC14465_11570 [alpha proteobacterium IMCC14465]|uniref:3-deoxy-D-manno-octulosonic acid transferase n=1 Tax=alpha proteobacterium IMCC14465 TaxID=1220535 RepID=J9DHI0_9PROT|nr:hypothetical protein IMCC14465_11570 [alpha proteobacterium IMCC14465]
MPLMFYIYRAVTWLIGPLTSILFRLRKKIGREDGFRKFERRGFAGMARPKGLLIWVHVASVGEMVTVLPLIRKLLEKFPEAQALLTSGTVTSAKIANDNPHERIIHQYVPMDHPGFAKRFVKHWRPDIGLFVESEIWPNLMHRAEQNNVPLFLINARMSQNSFKNWKRFPISVRHLLNQFNLILAQDSHSCVRYEMLGAKRIITAGNLKYDTPPLPYKATELQKLNQAIGNRPIWLAASTHETEEVSVAETHKNLKDKHPGLLSIIAPRHPQRGESLVKQLTEMNLTIARRSENQTIKADTDIYLADTIGDMGLLYRLCEIAFIGGTLTPRGGQNPLEAARLNTAIFYGPSTENFSEMFTLMKDEDAGRAITTQNDMTDMVDLLLSDATFRKKLSTNALKLIDKNKGATEETLTAVTPFLEKKISR